nr:NAD(P)H-hydrate dehydratase [Oceanococcus sp. HetDA_MAG_MS8]
MYSVAQVRRIDASAIAQQGDDGYALMEQAGYFAWRTLQRAFPRARRLCVLAGPGNNGGDALIVARLALQQGLDVQVYALSPAAQWRGAAGRAWQEYSKAGGVLCTDAPRSAEVIVDGLFGTGLTRSLSGQAADWVQWALDQKAGGSGVLALDIPSGLDADTGQALGPVLFADHTVSFVAPKLGHDLGDAIDACGRLHFSSLGVSWPEASLEAPQAWRVQTCQRPARLPATHKGHCGHVLLLAGRGQFAGAGRFAAGGALRAGAGKVSQLVQDPAAHPQDWPEVMHPSWSELPQLLPSVDVLCVGPGLGRGEQDQPGLPPMAAKALPQVWDADALWWLAQQPQRLEGVSAVLTPHPGEAATLLGLSTAEVQADRLGTLQALVQRYQCVVVLKGARTLVGAPGTTPRCVPQGNPAMATGGMGDVLAGLISGLWAQGLSAFDAATFGAYLLGRAADRAADNIGAALLPHDLLEQGELWT